MNSFETSRLCDEPARFVAKVQALGGPAKERAPLPVERIGRTRRRTVDQLCARYENENVHTEHVARLALKLFDATHRWLGVTRDERALLEAAGRLHDVAYRIDPVHHRERSAEIAWREGLPGFSTDERACIAAAMLLHGGRWKDQLDHRILKRVREPQRAMRLGAFLRVADGLDWGHLQDATIASMKKFRKIIRVTVRSDWLAANVARADDKADLWREVFPVNIRFVLAKSRRPRPVVEPDLHALEAARRLLSVQYKTIVADVDGAVVGDDPEHLHRIRVAIRRLRSLLRAFRKYLPDTGPIDETLRLFGDALGPARDLDVWVAFLRSEEITHVMQDNRRWRAFIQHHEQVRGLQRPTVRRELRGARFHALRRRMAKLLRTELPLLVWARPPVLLEEFAAKKFLKELRRVRALAPLRHSSSPEKLHCLRVALRRARYLGEFFGPVLGLNAAKLTRRLHQVERPLAQIHDLDVGFSLLQHSGPASPRVFAELLRAHREQQRRLVGLAWPRFVALEKKTRHGLQAKPKQTKPRRQI
ncbi:MAG TPA: CHAD domain-containing protein [Verrucomicrobiae bacterium]|nr:CHAD domain-containing protein [Verrucomicrobiae bacterium]